MEIGSLLLPPESLEEHERSAESYSQIEHTVCLYFLLIALIAGANAEQGNPHSAEPNTLQRALSLLQSGGSLTEATLLLEATLSSGTAAEQALSPSSQQNEGIPTLAGGEAAVWVLLGQIQAMDEKEVAAVRALEEGRRRFEVQQREGGQAEEGLKTMGEGLVVSRESAARVFKSPCR